VRGSNIYCIVHILYSSKGHAWLRGARQWDEAKTPIIIALRSWRWWLAWFCELMMCLLRANDVPASHCSLNFARAHTDYTTTAYLCRLALSRAQLVPRCGTAAAAAQAQAQPHSKDVHVLSLFQPCKMNWRTVDAVLCFTGWAPRRPSSVRCGRITPTNPNSHQILFNI
jgi:hypothetical protein